MRTVGSRDRVQRLAPRRQLALEAPARVGGTGGGQHRRLVAQHRQLRCELARCLAVEANEPCRDG
jgi:hypothetical protein